MRTGIVIAVCALIGLCGAARADDKPLDRAELDRRAARVAYDAAVAGTELFNRGRPRRVLPALPGDTPGAPADVRPSAGTRGGSRGQAGEVEGVAPGRRGV